MSNIIKKSPEVLKRMMAEEASADCAPVTGSAENVRLPNDTKIRFCNAMDALLQHMTECPACAIYLKSGDGDLCAAAKDTVATHLCYADIGLEFPPNDQALPQGGAKKGNDEH